MPLWPRNRRNSPASSFCRLAFSAKSLRTCSSSAVRPARSLDFNLAFIFEPAGPGRNALDAFLAPCLQVFQIRKPSSSRQQKRSQVVDFGFGLMNGILQNSRSLLVRSPGLPVSREISSARACEELPIRSISRCDEFLAFLNRFLFPVQFSARAQAVPTFEFPDFPACSEHFPPQLSGWPAVPGSD